MSHTRRKTTYCTEEEYGATKTYEVFADYNNSCDIVSFYDNNFKLLFTVHDTVNNNLMEALIRIWNENIDNTITDVVSWSKEDDEKYKERNRMV